MRPPEPTPGFERALQNVSDLLADARLWEQRGRNTCAGLFYARAEERALDSGYLELVRLVWSYSRPARKVA